MKKNFKNFVYILIIIALTLLPMITLPYIPNYLSIKPRSVPFDFINILIFLIADFVIIAIPAFVNFAYIRDFSKLKLKHIWFFILFGAIFGVILGEGANPIMLIPYIILMSIYAFLYFKFEWWKVALTSYLAGIIIENVLNRATIQSSTLIWIAFFICPYFAAKILENRNKKLLFKILKDFKLAFILSILIGLAGWYMNTINKNFNIRLIVIIITLPIIINIIYLTIKLIIKK